MGYFSTWILDGLVRLTGLVVVASGGLALAAQVVHALANVAYRRMGVSKEFFAFVVHRRRRKGGGS